MSSPFISATLLISRPHPSHFVLTRHFSSSPLTSCPHPSSLVLTCHSSLLSSSFYPHPHPSLIIFIHHPRPLLITIIHHSYPQPSPPALFLTPSPLPHHHPSPSPPALTLTPASHHPSHPPPITLMYMSPPPVPLFSFLLCPFHGFLFLSRLPNYPQSPSIISSPKVLNELHEGGRRGLTGTAVSGWLYVK